MKVIEGGGDYFFNNLNKSFIQNGGRGVVGYFMERCGHCENFQPEWNKFKSKMKHVKGVGVVAGVYAKNLDKLNFNMGDINGFPTLRIYTGGGNYYDYNGERSSKALMEEVTKNENLKGGFRKKRRRRRKRKKTKRRGIQNRRKRKSRYRTRRGRRR